MGRAKYVLAATLVLAGTVVASGCSRRCEHTRPIAFVSHAWRVDEPDCGTRAAMAQDIVRRHLLVGRTRRSVRALLGPADVVEAPVWTYELTPRLESDLPDFLEIRFGADRHVISAKTALAGTP